MDQRAISSVLVDLIMTMDPGNLDPEALFQSISPILRRVSGDLHVARMETLVKTEPNLYAPEGMERLRVLDFGGDPGPIEDALVLESDKLRNTLSSTTIYPVRGYIWDEEERRSITAIGKLLYAQLSRISMIEMQQKIATTDQMTGLSNTVGAIRFCERAKEQYSLADYASCFLNLKNLKYINRQMGNHAGDTALNRYATILNGMLDQKRELLARLGGDNFFAVVLKEHLDEFVKLATAMPLQLVSDQGQTGSITLGAWAGVYSANGSEKPRDLLDYASFAYELSKRNKVTVSRYDPSMMETSMHNRRISQTLPRALDNHELVPFYQPKVSMHTGNLYGCEALVRWVRGDKIVSPAEFLPVAENSDMIIRLDMYMLEAVCRDLRKWLDAGIEPVRVSINYSQRDFLCETLIEDTLAILDKYGIDGKYLEIEITETSFFESFNALENFIEAMHSRGMRVSLDDFGTGYSSLTLFENLNLDTVKLDRSFFLNMERKQDKGLQVLRSVADMLNRLEKVTVSEGVETPAQLELVDEIGLDIVQGYYFDKPMPRDDFTERLKSRYYKVDNPRGKETNL